jgi:AraC-like DNA-binding protein
VIADIPAVRTNSALREWEPSADALRAVASIWRRDSLPPGNSAADQVIVPDNCADIVVALDDGMQPSSAFVVGPMTVPLVLAHNRPARYAGIRFRSGWISRMLGVDAAELRDSTVALYDILPSARRLLDAAFGKSSGTDVLKQLATVAESLDAGMAPDSRVIQAMARIESSGGQISIARLAADVGVSRQHLARLFDMHVGVTPKFAARVARIRRVLARGARMRSRSWSALALEAGFVDQAHLVNDFAELTGRTPTAWFRSS